MTFDRDYTKDQRLSFAQIAILTAINQVENLEPENINQICKWLNINHSFFLKQATKLVSLGVLSKDLSACVCIPEYTSKIIIENQIKQN